MRENRFDLALHTLQLYPWIVNARVLDERPRQGAFLLTTG